MAGEVTLEMVDSVLYSDGECGVVFIVDSNDGSLESEAASSRPTLHLVLRLQQREGERQEYHSLTQLEIINKIRLDKNTINSALPFPDFDQILQFESKFNLLKYNS